MHQPRQPQGLALQSHAAAQHSSSGHSAAPSQQDLTLQRHAAGPRMATQRQQLAQLRAAASGSVVQRAASVKDFAKRPTQRAGALWAQCADMIRGFVEGSGFRDLDKVNCVVQPVSTGPGTSLGSTSVYQLDDGDVWQPVRLPHQFDSNEFYCVYLTLNLNERNADPAEIYATFLHEWHAHALPALAMIQGNVNQTISDGELEDAEHRAYARTSEEALADYATGFGLADELHAEVKRRLVADHNRYSTETGKQIPKQGFF